MSVALNETVRKMVESEVKTIKSEYRGVVSEESIDSIANESLQRLAGSRVPMFVPLFVGRFTRERLREMNGLRRVAQPPPGRVAAESTSA